MYYTKAMIEMLRKMGEPYITYFSHYLDTYFDTLEEPDIDIPEIKKRWFLLLVCGLTAEIKRQGSHMLLAKSQLRKLLNINAKWYENQGTVTTVIRKKNIDKDGNITEVSKVVPTAGYALKYIREVESNTEVLGQEGQDILIHDKTDGIEYRMPKRWLLRWANAHNRYWENFGMNISYVIHEAFREWKNEDYLMSRRKETELESI